MTVGPHLFVVVGGTGDLARRKLLPAYHRLARTEGIAQHVAVLLVGARPRPEEQVRAMVREALVAAGEVSAPWCDRVRYLAVGDGSWEQLRDTVRDIEARHHLAGDRLVYVALPPDAVAPAIRGLGEAGIAEAPARTRLVLEKPFGTDLISARALNELLHRWFPEEAVLRIDHYLGKETVRNLLAFRFANSLFERTWNRDHVTSVEITVAETVGVEGRVRSYDRTGVVRDMLQSHLTQILTLVAMEPPVRLDAASIRDEKVKVLRAMSPADPALTILGRYGPGRVDGEPVAGYLDLDGVGPASQTPTFVAVRAAVDTWRWQGVPFVLRTGKRLARRTSRIVVRYRRPPVCLLHPDCPGHENVLVLTLQPDEGFDLFFTVKRPGDTMDTETIPLSVRYADTALGPLPDAYSTLLRDALEGDRTLFVRGDEVEEAWRVWEPLLQHAEPELYAAGSWGPAEVAERLGVSLSRP